MSRTPQRFLECSMTCRVAPATLFWVSEKINACFLTVGTFVLGCPLSSFFRRRKKKQKSHRDTCGCVPGLKPQVAIINCSPLWLQTVHRTVCGARRARNAFYRKFLPTFFYKKGRLLRRSSRKTNFVLIFTLTQKFFAYFFTKRSVTPPLKQKNQLCFNLYPNTKVFCLLFYKKVGRRYKK